MKNPLISLLLTPLLALSFFSTVHAQTLTDTITDPAASTCVNLTKDMRTGSKDSTTDGQVSDLQFFLSDKGYLKTDPTGYFGPATLAAVKAFQADNSVPQTGNVGPLTRSKVTAVSCSNDEPISISLNPVDPVSPTSIGNLSVGLSFGGQGVNGSPVSGTNVTNVNPMYPRTWSWTTSGAASVSARWTMSGANCMKSAYGTLNETNWQPWLGANITGTRFSGSNSLTLGNQYYGCTLDATYTARNTSGQSVSSSVHVVFANSAATSPTGYTCNGVQQATPCQATNNQATNVQCLPENFIWADDFYNTTVNSSGQAVHLNCTAPIVSSGAIGTKYNLTALNGGQANGSSWQNGFGGVTAECAMINGVPKWKVSSSGTKTCTATAPTGSTVCAEGQTLANTTCVPVANAMACQTGYIRNSTGACIDSRNCASWSGTQCNQSGPTTSCPLGYKVFGDGASAYCVVDQNVTTGGTVTTSSINVSNKPGLVCANSLTTSGDSTTANVYSRNAAGVLTLVETCRGNEGKIAGISSRGIQCQTNSQGIGATCSSQGSVYINGQSSMWKGNTSGYCYSNSACDNGYTCGSNNMCTPKVQFTTDHDATDRPVDASTAQYKRTWSGTSWGAWTFISCWPGNHKDVATNTCVPDVKSCPLANAQGTMTYNVTSGQWGTCQLASDASCNADSHKEGSVCVLNTRTCTSSDNYPTQYPRGSAVATGMQQWESLSGGSWGKCEVKCKTGYVKRTAYSQSGSNEFNIGYGSVQSQTGITSNAIDYCIAYPRTIDVSVSNITYTTPINTTQIKVNLSAAQNLKYCNVAVVSNNGVKRTYDNLVPVGSGSSQVNMSYADLALTTQGGKVIVTCESDNLDQLPSVTFEKSYSPAVPATTASTCTGGPLHEVNGQCTSCPNSSDFWNGTTCVGSGTATINSFTALPLTATLGQTIAFTWSASGANGCTLSSKANMNLTGTTYESGKQLQVSSGEVVGGKAVYTLTCGTAVKTQEVTITNASTVSNGTTQKPIITSFKVNTQSATVGQMLNFTWSSTGSNGCTLSATEGGMNVSPYTQGFTGTSGSFSTQANSQIATTVYRLTCSNMAGDSPVSSLSVVTSNPSNAAANQTTPAATCSVSLNTNSISSDQAFTANITSSGYDSVEYTFNGATSAFSTANGSQTFDPINTPGSYSSVVKGVKNGVRTPCSNSPVNFTVTQAAVAEVPPTIDSLTQSTSNVTETNVPFTISWKTSNTASCTFQAAVSGQNFATYSTLTNGSVGPFTLATPESYIGKLTCLGSKGTVVERQISHTVVAPVAAAPVVPASSCSVSVNKKSIYTDEPLTVSVASNGYTGMQYSLNLNAYQTWSYAVNSNEVFPAGTFTPGTYKYYFRGTPASGNTSCGSGEANGAVTITVQARPAGTTNQNAGTDGGGPGSDGTSGNDAGSTNADGSVGTGNQG